MPSYSSLYLLCFFKEVANNEFLTLSLILLVATQYIAVREIRIQKLKGYISYSRTFTITFITGFTAIFASSIWKFLLGLIGYDFIVFFSTLIFSIVVSLIISLFLYKKAPIESGTDQLSLESQAFRLDEVLVIPGRKDIIYSSILLASYFLIWYKLSDWLIPLVGIIWFSIGIVKRVRSSIRSYNNAKSNELNGKLPSWS